MMLTVYVAGYPRSGNVWLGRLLADALDCVYQVSDSDFEYPRDHTTTPYIVRKSHAPSTPDVAHTVFLYRDPRDVAVSIWHYLNLPDLESAIAGMNDRFDKFGVKSYQAMWFAWREHPAQIDIRYEHIHVYSIHALRSVIHALLGIDVSDFILERAMNRQSFDAMRRRYPDSQHHARLGVPGNWRGYFTQSDGGLMQEYFGEIMLEQGYTTGADWWQALPERLIEP